MTVHNNPGSPDPTAHSGTKEPAKHYMTAHRHRLCRLSVQEHVNAEALDLVSFVCQFVEGSACLG